MKIAFRMASPNPLLAGIDAIATALTPAPAEPATEPAEPEAAEPEAAEPALKKKKENLPALALYINLS